MRQDEFVTVTIPLAFENVDGTYDEETEELMAKALSTREILEQTLEILNPVPVNGTDVILQRWIKGDWVKGPGVLGYDPENDTYTARADSVACSMGAMLLATEMTGLQAFDWNVEPYFAADPNFARAVQLLVLAIASETDFSLDGWEDTSLEALGLLESQPRPSLTPSQQNALVSAITSWNDHEDTTASDVLTVFTAAIKRAIREEEQA